MKFVHTSIMFVAITFISTSGNKLSQRITDLLQEALDESKKTEQFHEVEKQTKMENKEKKVEESHTKGENKHKSVKRENLSKKITALLQEVQKESKKADLNDIDEIVNDAKTEDIDEIGVEENSDSIDEIDHDSPLIIKATDGTDTKVKKNADSVKKVNDVTAMISETSETKTLNNVSLIKDIEEESTKSYTVDVTKKEMHPKQCSGKAFNKAVDTIAQIVKEGIIDKLTEDFASTENDPSDDINESDIKEEKVEKVVKSKTTKETKSTSQPNECGDGSFDQTVDRLANMVKRGVLHKLVLDLRHKKEGDDAEEIIAKDIPSNDAQPIPWTRRRANKIIRRRRTSRRRRRWSW